mgnify:CR=1 FL=1
MTVPQEIFELVGRFENNREAYRSGAYNETQLRREFVDPFFKILGWDVNNEKGYAEAYKDVIHEDSIKKCEKKCEGHILKKCEGHILILK